MRVKQSRTRAARAVTVRETLPSARTTTRFKTLTSPPVPATMSSAKPSIARKSAERTRALKAITPAMARSKSQEPAPKECTVPTASPVLKSGLTLERMEWDKRRPYAQTGLRAAKRIAAQRAFKFPLTSKQFAHCCEPSFLLECNKQLMTLLSASVCVEGLSLLLTLSKGRRDLVAAIQIVEVLLGSPLTYAGTGQHSDDHYAFGADGHRRAGSMIDLPSGHRSATGCTPRRRRTGSAAPSSRRTADDILPRAFEQRKDTMTAPTKLRSASLSDMPAAGLGMSDSSEEKEFVRRRERLETLDTDWNDWDELASLDSVAIRVKAQSQMERRLAKRVRDEMDEKRVVVDSDDESNLMDSSDESDTPRFGAAEIDAAIDDLFHESPSKDKPPVLSTRLKALSIHMDKALSSMDNLLLPKAAMGAAAAKSKPRSKSRVFTILEEKKEDLLLLKKASSDPLPATVVGSGSGAAAALRESSAATTTATTSSVPLGVLTKEEIKSRVVNYGVELFLKLRSERIRSLSEKLKVKHKASAKSSTSSTGKSGDMAAITTETTTVKTELKETDSRKSSSIRSASKFSIVECICKMANSSDFVLTDASKRESAETLVSPREAGELRCPPLIAGDDVVGELKKRSVHSLLAAPWCLPLLISLMEDMPFGVDSYELSSLLTDKLVAAVEMCDSKRQTEDLCLRIFWRLTIECINAHLSANEMRALPVTYSPLCAETASQLRAEAVANRWLHILHVFATECVSRELCSPLFILTGVILPNWNALLTAHSSAAGDSRVVVTMCEIAVATMHPKKKSSTTTDTGVGIGTVVTGVCTSIDESTTAVRSERKSTTEARRWSKQRVANSSSVVVDCSIDTCSLHWSVSHLMALRSGVFRICANCPKVCDAWLSSQLLVDWFNHCVIAPTTAASMTEDSLMARLSLPLLNQSDLALFRLSADCCVMNSSALLSLGRSLVPFSSLANNTLLTVDITESFALALDFAIAFAFAYFLRPDIDAFIDSLLIDLASKRLLIVPFFESMSAHTNDDSLDGFKSVLVSVVNVYCDCSSVDFCQQLEHYIVKLKAQFQLKQRSLFKLAQVFRLPLCE